MRYAKGSPLVFLDVDENSKLKWGFSVFGKKEIIKQLGKTISLLPFPEAIVSTVGLKWEMVKTKLSVYANSSIRNVVASEEANILLHSGNLLVTIDDK